MPVVDSLTPNCGERGTMMKIAVWGRHFDDPETILDFGEGIRVESLVLRSGSEIEATLVIGHKAELGLRCVSATKVLEDRGGAQLRGIFTVLGHDLASAVENQGSRPTCFSLAEPYPNPFNSSLVIHFGLPERAAVRILVYNLLGHVVAQIFSGDHGPGSYRIPWIANDIPSGVYFIEMNAESFDFCRRFRASKRVVYLK
jgi:hypothetical protein